MRYLYFSMLLMGALSTQAQSKTYAYTYDQAGNRTARNVVYLRIASPNNSTATAVQQTAKDSSAIRTYIQVGYVMIKLLAKVAKYLFASYQ